jgi:hypothetical protein
VREALSLILLCGLIACTAGGDAGEGEGRLEGDGSGAIGEDGDDPDLDAPDAGSAAACATESVGDLAGTARVRYSGSGGYSETSATVVWTLVETTGCVDRYEPSGTATPGWAGGFCVTNGCAPADGAIAASDGSLTLDRSATPATYLASGETRFAATTSCELSDGTVEENEGEVGGVWLKDVAGTVEDGALGGLDDSGSVLVELSFAIAN